ncbi:MAG: dephospho-CoA kinase [Acidobacteria bacterium]|nr:MAG: dephospho-CoA kinase [Acidobacteriota bacterium]
MLRLGLTGGIASGKSTVAAMLREMGFAVLDADSLAHRLIERGEPAHEEILREFGPAITDASGSINRVQLANVVFADRAKLDHLNAIVHPRVADVVFRQFDEWERNGVRDAAFVEAALLIEADLDKKLDGLIVAWCKPEQQLERLVARGLTEAEARRRIAAQLSVEEKLRHATEKIDCSGSLEETSRQVAALAAKLRRQTAR